MHAGRTLLHIGNQLTVRTYTLNRSKTEQERGFYPAEIQVIVVLAEQGYFTHWFMWIGGSYIKLVLS